MDSKFILLEDLLSQTECQLLIKLCEVHGFSTQNRNKHGVVFEDSSFRSDLQCTLHDPELAKTIFDRIRGDITGEPVGINPDLRFSKYLPGQKCSLHQDGVLSTQDGKISKLSLIIYLNDTNDTGATRFIDVETMQHTDVFPKTGRALLFEHAIPHAGITTEIVKYVLRSDILFESPKVAHSGRLIVRD